MKRKELAYLILLIVGVGITQYCYIPSFTIPFLKWQITHLQPEWEVLMKCISISMLTLSLCILFALWHYKWIRLVMCLFTWGMCNNAVDEFTNQATIFGSSEKISLLLALLTTIVLIWHRHRAKKLMK